MNNELCDCIFLTHHTIESMHCSSSCVMYLGLQMGKHHFWELSPKFLWWLPFHTHLMHLLDIEFKNYQVFTNTQWYVTHWPAPSEGFTFFLVYIYTFKLDTYRWLHWLVWTCNKWVLLTLYGPQTFAGHQMGNLVIFSSTLTQEFLLSFKNTWSLPTVNLTIPNNHCSLVNLVNVST